MNNFAGKIPQDYKDIISKITAAAKDNNFIIYAVGGFVRDILLERRPNDLDIMVEGENGGIKFANFLSEKLSVREPVVFEKFGTAKLFIDGKEIEFIMPRKEYYQSGSRNPSTEIGSLQQDALRRDFTVNALFLRLNDMALLDLCKTGLEDLKNKIIRVTDEPAADIIFSQDPLRTLRAVRQSFQLDFAIDKKTYDAMARQAERISIVSAERIRDELNKILLLDCPSKAFEMLDDTGLLNILIPELKKTQNVPQPVKYHDKDVFGHTMDVVDRIEPLLLLRVAALLHDAGKPDARKEADGKISFIGHENISVKIAKNILAKFKYPADFIKQVLFLIQNHMYAKMYNESWSDSAVRRFVKRMSPYFEYIKQFARADAKNYQSGLFDRIEILRKNNKLAPDHDLFNGDELISLFDKPSGKWISEIKEYIENLQFEEPGISKERVISKLKKIIGK